MIARNVDPAFAGHRKQPELHLHEKRATLRLFPRAGGQIDIELDWRYALMLVILHDQWQDDRKNDRPNAGWMTRPLIAEAYLALTGTWSITPAAVTSYLCAIKRVLPEDMMVFERRRGAGARLASHGLRIVEERRGPRTPSRPRWHRSRTRA